MCAKSSLGLAMPTITFDKFDARNAMVDSGRIWTAWLWIPLAKVFGMMKTSSSPAVGVEMSRIAESKIECAVDRYPLTTLGSPRARSYCCHTLPMQIGQRRILFGILRNSSSITRAASFSQMSTSSSGWSAPMVLCIKAPPQSYQFPCCGPSILIAGSSRRYSSWSLLSNRCVEHLHSFEAYIPRRLGAFICRSA